MQCEPSAECIRNRSKICCSLSHSAQCVQRAFAECRACKCAMRAECHDVNNAPSLRPIRVAMRAHVLPMRANARCVQCAKSPCPLPLWKTCTMRQVPLQAGPASLASKLRLCTTCEAVLVLGQNLAGPCQLSVSSPIIFCVQSAVIRNRSKSCCLEHAAGSDIAEMKPVSESNPLSCCVQSTYSTSRERVQCVQSADMWQRVRCAMLF